MSGEGWKQNAPPHQDLSAGVGLGPGLPGRSFFLSSSLGLVGRFLSRSSDLEGRLRRSQAAFFAA
jgi:hypothetical protein